LMAGDPWDEMREETELSLNETGMAGRGEYSGVINGQDVRARTETRNTGQSTEGGSGKTTFTITEADLDEPVENGLIVRQEPDADGRLNVSDDSAVRQTVIKREFVVTGFGSEQFHRDLITADVREAIRAVDDEEMITAGEASEVVSEELPDVGDSMVGGFLKDKMVSAMTTKVGGSVNTVGIESRGVLDDPSVLDARIAAVAAVANAHSTVNRAD